MDGLREARRVRGVAEEYKRVQNFLYYLLILIIEDI